MGDNICSGDRDGVRTPDAVDPRPQRRVSTTADPQRMHLPLVADPVYGYQVTNVEQQMRNTTSICTGSGG